MQDYELIAIYESDSHQRPRYEQTITVWLSDCQCDTLGDQAFFTKKENGHYWSSVMGTTGDRWIPLTKGQ